MRIESTEIREGDVLVVNSPDVLSSETIKRISEIVDEKFPGHKVLVLSAGFTLQVVRPAA